MPAAPTGDDLLSVLLRASEDGVRMSDEQVRDEAMTLFLAGHETTSIALTWTWCLLALNPEVEASCTTSSARSTAEPTVLDDLPRLAIHAPCSTSRSGSARPRGRSVATPSPTTARAS